MIRRHVTRLPVASTYCVRQLEAAAETALQKHNHFLEPVIHEMKAANPAQPAQRDKDLHLTYRSPITQTQPAK